jgi:hypothetical protein
MQSISLKRFSTVTELQSKEEGVLTLKGVGFKVTGSYGVSMCTVTGPLEWRYVELSCHRDNLLIEGVSYWLDK